MNKKEELIKFGKKLVESGLTYAFFGNISVRKGNKILIKKTGAELFELDENSIVEVDIYKESGTDKSASVELPVHREIYKNTDSGAVIHAHCPFAVIMSLISENNKIIPIDGEGKYFLNEILILGGEPGSEELAKNASCALSKCNGIIVKGHGTFARGKNLRDAFITTAMIENSCKIRYYVDAIKK